MDNSKKYKNPHPRQGASYFSVLSFWWMKEIFYNGCPDVEDLFSVCPSDKSEVLGNILEKNWLDQLMEYEDGSFEPNFWKAVMTTFSKAFYLPALLMFLYNVVFRAAQSLFLARLIQFFCYNNTSSIYEAYLNALGVSVTTLILVLLLNQCIYLCSMLGLRMRVAICSLLYRKVVHLSNMSASEAGAGHVINLISNDACRFQNYPFCIQILWIAPVQMIVFTVIMWMYVGPAALVGLGAILLQILLVQVFSRDLMSKYCLNTSELKDMRVKLISEIISGIQLIKMHVWERPFEKMVNVARSVEIDALTKVTYLEALILTCRLCSEKVSVFVTLIAYILLGNEITPDKVFVTIHLFNTLHVTLCNGVPLAIKYLSQTEIAIQKFQSFVLLEENCSPVPINMTKDSFGVILDNITAKWTPSSDRNTFSNVSLHVPRGKLYMIVGPVGGGKSSLLRAILGDLPLSKGKISVKGKMSYSSQEPWLFTGTVRKNILFGNQYELKRYNEVLLVCGLQKELYWFPNGDGFIVGDNVVSLSEAQSALISLARAVYHKADIYLLDDPLLAVESRMSKYVFEKCIMSFLADKTRIFTTDQLEHLEFADLIVIIKDGCIQHQGTMGELLSQGIDLTTFLADNKVVKKDQDIVKESNIKKVHRMLATVSLENTPTYNERYSTVRLHHRTSTFLTYWYTGSGIFVLLALMVVFIASQLAVIGCDYYISIWANHEPLKQYDSHLNVNKNQKSIYTSVSKNGNLFQYNIAHYKNSSLGHQQAYTMILHSMTYIKMYGIWLGITIVFLILRSLCFANLCMRSSKKLHHIMFAKVLRANMTFFNNNSIDSIVNRFSKDMGLIDNQMPSYMLECLQIFLMMAGVTTLILLMNYQLAALVFLNIIVFYKSHKTYLSTAQNGYHLERITKSSMLAHVSASLSGLPTIRANGAQELLRKEFDNLQDIHTSASQMSLFFSIFLSFVMNIMHLILTIGAAFSFLLFDMGFSGSDVGLTITQIMALAGITNYGIFLTDVIARRMRSVEKLLRYSFVTTEPDLDSIHDEIASKNWPTKGAINYRNVKLRYSRYEPIVLNNINISIQPGHKVGIVGTTGAGKTSLVTLLFRLTPFEGTLLIDNVNTKSVGLYDLRKKISIITRKPVLFSATLRDNLDPLREYTDLIIWDALKQVKLDQVVSSLDFIVTEGGSNLTLGQRQLVSFARAIIRKNKILVLAAASTNFDPQTNELIQKIIRCQFQDCTVLAVDYHPKTVIDFDDIIVMDVGQIMEYDHPHILLQNNDGLFYKIVQDTGKAMAAQLTKLALDTWWNIHGYG